MQFWVLLSLSTRISKINTQISKEMCAHPLLVVHFDRFERKMMNNLPRLPRIFIGDWAAACYSCGWFYPAAGYELRLSRILAAGYKLQLSRVPAAGYKLRLTPSYGWLELRQQDTSFSWLNSTADSSSGGWLRLKANSILRLTTSCGWFYSAGDSIPPAGLDFRLTYTLVYQVNLRTCSAKYIIFMVCFLPSDFSYHWSRLCLVLQEPGSSLRKLEDSWRSLKRLAATDSSCNGWFDLRRLIRGLQPIDYLHNFDPDAPWYTTYLICYKIYSELFSTVSAGMSAEGTIFT